MFDFCFELSIYDCFNLLLLHTHVHGPHTKVFSLCIIWQSNSIGICHFTSLHNLKRDFVLYIYLSLDPFISTKQLVVAMAEPGFQASPGIQIYNYSIIGASTLYYLPWQIPSCSWASNPCLSANLRIGGNCRLSALMSTHH